LAAAVNCKLETVNFPSRAARLLALIAVLLCAVKLSAQPKLSKQDATRFQVKLAQIEKNAGTRRRGSVTRTTQVSDGEINAYLKFLAGSQVPVGIVEPALHAAGGGLVTGRAIVDLDAVRTQKKRAWTDPLGYLTGRLPVTAEGHLTTQAGVGRFTLDSAAISGVTIPKSLLQELLSFYSRTPQNPAGINMDQPFALPASIQEIRVGQGSAVVIQ
jgi:hypothetical protein